MTALAVACAALAVLLAWPVPARPPVPARGGRRLGPLVPVLVGAALVGVLPVVLDGTRLGLGLVLLGCLAGAADVVRRGRGVRAADRRRVAVVEAAESLAAELRAGQPVGRALERTVDVWPDFGRVEAAARLGADVPTALRELAGRPGAEALADVAAAWQVSHASGAGLATALGQVAAGARARQATRHVVAAELASARATAQMVALLPLAVLAMASGVGGSPWHFLLGTPAGLVCLGAGAALAFAGLRWIDRIAVAVLR